MSCDGWFIGRFDVSSYIGGGAHIISRWLVKERDVWGGTSSYRDVG
jgi:hypothetical protein